MQSLVLPVGDRVVDVVIEVYFEVVNGLLGIYVRTGRHSGMSLPKKKSPQQYS